MLVKSHTKSMPPTTTLMTSMLLSKKASAWSRQLKMFITYLLSIHNGSRQKQALPDISVEQCISVRGEEFESPTFPTSRGRSNQLS